MISRAVWLSLFDECQKFRSGDHGRPLTRSILSHSIIGSKIWQVWHDATFGSSRIRDAWLWKGIFDVVPAIVTRKSYHFCQRSIFDGLYIISLIAKDLSPNLGPRHWPPTIERLFQNRLGYLPMSRQEFVTFARCDRNHETIWVIQFCSFWWFLRKSRQCSLFLIYDGCLGLFFANWADDVSIIAICETGAAHFLKGGVKRVAVVLGDFHKPTTPWPSNLTSLLLSPRSCPGLGRNQATCGTRSSPNLSRGWRPPYRLLELDAVCGRPSWRRWRMGLGTGPPGLVSCRHPAAPTCSV